MCRKCSGTVNTYPPPQWHSPSISKMLHLSICRRNNSYIKYLPFPNFCSAEIDVNIWPTRSLGMLNSTNLARRLYCAVHLGYSTFSKICAKVRQHHPHLSIAGRSILSTIFPCTGSCVQLFRRGWVMDRAQPA